jgi:hypothetical protein
MVPIKLTLKDKDTRFQAELTLKKACRVKTARLPSLAGPSSPR